MVVFLQRTLSVVLHLGKERPYMYVVLDRVYVVQASIDPCYFS
jgi:hypothetical protein